MYSYSVSTLLKLRIVLQSGCTNMNGLELGGVQLDVLAATLWAAWSSTHAYARVIHAKDARVKCTAEFGANDPDDARHFDSVKFRIGVSRLLDPSLPSILAPPEAREGPNKDGGALAGSARRQRLPARTRLKCGLV